MPFNEVTARFDNGQRLRVTRNTDDAASGQKPTPTVTLRLYRGTNLKHKFTLPSISHDEFPYPMSAIEEWIPTLDQIGPRMWPDVETGERISFHDVVHRYGHEFPADPTASDWNTGVA